MHVASGFLLGILGFLLVYVMNEKEELSFFGMNMQKSGLVDTMWDLIVDTIGATVIAVLGVWLAAYRRDRFLPRAVDRIVRGVEPPPIRLARRRRRKAKRVTVVASIPTGLVVGSGEGWLLRLVDENGIVLRTFEPEIPLRAIPQRELDSINAPQVNAVREVMASPLRVPWRRISGTTSTQTGSPLIRESCLMTTVDSGSGTSRD